MPSPIDLREIIFSAVSAVIQRQLILSAFPVDEDSATPYFARLPEINLEEAVMFFTRQNNPYDGHSQDPELDSVLEKQHNTDFKINYGEVAFWRLVILTKPNSQTDFAASFIYHHSRGDGASGVAFQKHFFSAVKSAPAALKSKVIPTPNTPLLHNLELLHPLPIPASFPSRPSRPWTGGLIHLPVKTHIQTHVFPQDLTTHLLYACRTHQATLTATLAVLITRVLIHLPLASPERKRIIPTNIRRFLPDDRIADDDMGVWIDDISILYHSEI
jgi:hypothetical protein